MAQNEALKAAIKNWVEAVVAQTQSTVVPATRDDIINISATVPEYRAVLGEFDKDAVITKHFKSLIESDALGEPIIITPGEILNRFLSLFTDEKNTLFFEPEHYETAYKYFEKVFYEDYIEYRAMAPISQLLIHILREAKENSKTFDDDTEPIELAPDLVIKALNIEQRKMVYQLELVRRMQPQMGEFINALCIEYRFLKRLSPIPETMPEPFAYSFEQPSPLEIKMHEINQLLYETVALLRLYKPGNISCGGVVHFGRNLLVGGIQYPFPGEPMQFSPPMPLYILSREDTAPLHNLRNCFQKVKTDPALKNLLLALRRLNYARLRGDVEDRIIDLMIAAETLAKPLNNDKSTFIAEYFSTFFPGAESKTKDLMRKIYQMRNSIMHDGSLEKWTRISANRRLNIFDIAAAGEEIVRQVLIREIEK